MSKVNNRYEKLADIDKYCYFVRAGGKSLDYEIACLPHFHKNREFLFCLQGPQEVVINGQKLIVEAGDIVYVDEFEIHSYSNCKNAEAYILVLSASCFVLFDQNFVNQRLPRLMRKTNKTEEIFSLIKEWNSVHRKEKFVEDHYKTLVNSNRLFLLLFEEYGTEKRNDLSNKTNIVNILNYIDEHYNENINMEMIAKRFGFTKQYFSKTFNAHLGENFRSYLNNLRINNFLQIKERVGKSETIIKIAFDCGFNSEATFYRAYKSYLEKIKVKEI